MTIDSGLINIVNGSIIYKSTTYTNWEIPIANIIVVGEYTNDQGPLLDDWFICFLVDDLNGWHEASNYADGISDFKKEFLETKGVSNMYSDLGSSTDYNSFILWPNELYGKPLFNFTNVYTSWWSRVLFSPKIKFNLSENIINHFKQS